MAMSNLRSIALAICSYADENKGKLPETINQFTPYLSDNKILTNPRQPNRKIGFVYLKPAVLMKDIKDSGRCIIAYEYYKSWPENGLCAAFADGHVEIIRIETNFKKLLKESAQNK